jgi:hypothetical protein
VADWSTQTPGVKHFFPIPADDYERELLDRVTQSNGSTNLDSLTPERLRALTASEGCDFATALLHRRIVESDRHAPFLRGLNKAPSGDRARSMRVAIVPGAFFRENPRTGADGRLPAEVAKQLGFEVLVAPISSTGWLAENARILAEWISNLGGDPIILVSVSKGGSDVKAALARPDATGVFQHVIGWINLCGILDGTPMADWLLSASLLARVNRFIYRIRGRSLEFLTDLQRFPECALDFPLTLPPRARAVHVVGFPLRRHLRNGLGRRCHARLEPFGPNDGSILLSDAPGWPGQLCPVWGADHYMRPREDVRPLLAAILNSFSQ